jgi:hypothetical protein
MNNLEEIVKKVREKVQYVILGGASGGATVYRIARYFLSYHINIFQSLLSIVIAT